MIPYYCLGTTDYGLNTSLNIANDCALTSVTDIASNICKLPCSAPASTTIVVTTSRASTVSSTSLITQGGTTKSGSSNLVLNISLFLLSLFIWLLKNFKISNIY